MAAMSSPPSSLDKAPAANGARSDATDFPRLEDAAVQTDREHKRHSGHRLKQRYPVLLTPQKFHGAVAQLATLSMLGIFAFLGLLARLGLVAINTYDGQVVFPIVWAQIVGCVVMGLVTSRRDEIEATYLPLYSGLTTGLCGSITTFSSWMAGVFMGFAQIDSHPHGGFSNFMNGLSQSVITLAVSVSAFMFGSHLGPMLLPARVMRRLIPRTHNTTKEEQDNLTTLPHHQVTMSAIGLAVSLLFLGMWITTILICVYVQRWRGIVMLSLILSPLGVWLRFYLSAINPHFVKFPLGTFLANMLGTAILATVLALQRTPTRTTLQCQVLQGFGDGFCGCLSTISTFVAEIRKLDRRRSYTYVMVSYAAGQCIMLLILGSVDFARGGLQPRCSLH